MTTLYLKKMENWTRRCDCELSQVRCTTLHDDITRIYKKCREIGFEIHEEVFLSFLSSSSSSIFLTIITFIFIFVKIIRNPFYKRCEEIRFKIHKFSSSLSSSSPVYQYIWQYIIIIIILTSLSMCPTDSFSFHQTDKQVWVILQIIWVIADWLIC